MKSVGNSLLVIRSELSHTLRRGVEGMGWLRDGSIPLRFQGWLRHE
jgi:hypothetical protein